MRDRKGVDQDRRDGKEVGWVDAGETVFSYSTFIESNLYLIKREKTWNWEEVDLREVIGLLGINMIKIYHIYEIFKWLIISFGFLRECILL